MHEVNQHIYNQSLLTPKDLEFFLIALRKDGQRIKVIQRTTPFAKTYKGEACSYMVISESENK